MSDIAGASSAAAPSALAISSKQKASETPTHCCPPWRRQASGMTLGILKKELQGKADLVLRKNGVPVPSMNFKKENDYVQYAPTLSLRAFWALMAETSKEVDFLTLKNILSPLASSTAALSQGQKEILNAVVKADSEMSLFMLREPVEGSRGVKSREIMDRELPLDATHWIAIANKAEDMLKSASLLLDSLPPHVVAAARNAVHRDNDRREPARIRETTSFTTGGAGDLHVLDGEEGRAGTSGLEERGGVDFEEDPFVLMGSESAEFKSGKRAREDTTETAYLRSYLVNDSVPAISSSPTKVPATDPGPSVSSSGKADISAAKSAKKWVFSRIFEGAKKALQGRDILQEENARLRRENARLRQENKEIVGHVQNQMAELAVWRRRTEDYGRVLHISADLAARSSAALQHSDPELAVRLDTHQAWVRGVPPPQAQPPAGPLQSVQQGRPPLLAPLPPTAYMGRPPLPPPPPLFQHLRPPPSTSSAPMHIPAGPLPPPPRVPLPDPQRRLHPSTQVFPAVVFNPGPGWVSTAPDSRGRRGAPSGSEARTTDNVWEEFGR